MLAGGGEGAFYHLSRGGAFGGKSSQFV